MKRIFPLTILLFMLAAFAGTIWFLYQKSQQRPVVFKTQAPAVMDIVKKTVATGALVPREEIEIKPRVSGIVESLHVEPGQDVEKGQLIAKIAIVPDIASLNRAQAQVEAARISFESAKRELERQQNLFDRQVVSGAALEERRVAFELRKQELTAAQNNLEIVRRGATKKSKQTSDNTEVRSTVAGTVLELPVKEGASVIESNTFNPGTTIAVVADMSDMIFQGEVDESEVGRLKEGMELGIKIGALDNQVLQGTLEYIAPKGMETEGVIQFEVKAAIKNAGSDLPPLRAGYSANADIVLDRRTQVLAIEERLLQFGKDKKPYVEVEVAEQEFARRDIEVGLSDGIHIEVLSGLDKDTRIKQP